MTDDFYDLLDVPSDASQDEIKLAYREQVRIYHPDHNDDDRAQAQFTALQKAYEILGDPVERKAYDRLGHEDYVAKRTKGLPSPDVWRTSSADSSSSSATSTSEQVDETRAEDEADDPWATAGPSASRTTDTGSADASGATGGGDGADGASVGSSGVGAARTNGVGTASGTATASGTGTAAGSGSTGARGGAGTNGSPAGATSSAGYGSRSGRGSHSGSRPGPLTDNPVARWWRNRNFAWPLIWLAALTYLLGLGQFVAANESAARSLAADLVAAGADANAVRELLAGGRRGIDGVPAFLAGVELVASPLPPAQWYAALSGLVACSLLVVVAARVAWRRNTWGPVSIDETIVVSLAIGVSTTLVGGPLLAGTVLLPLLFGVVVHRTRALPGWSPSYAYVVAVAAPAVALAAHELGYGSLALDLLAFGILPIAGAVGLPLRVAIRKRLGW